MSDHFFSSPDYGSSFSQDPPPPNSTYENLSRFRFSDAIDFDEALFSDRSMPPDGDVRRRRSSAQHPAGFLAPPSDRHEFIRGHAQRSSLPENDTSSSQYDQRSSFVETRRHSPYRFPQRFTAASHNASYPLNHETHPAYLDATHYRNEKSISHQSRMDVSQYRNDDSLMTERYANFPRSQSEAMYNRNSSAVTTEAPPPVYPQRKRRRRTSQHELDILETAFAKDPLPNTMTREKLGGIVNMNPRAIQVWFQNRRQAAKRRKNAAVFLPKEKGKLSAANDGAVIVNNFPQISSDYDHSSEPSFDLIKRRLSLPGSMLSSQNMPQSNVSNIKKLPELVGLAPIVESAERSAPHLSKLASLHRLADIKQVSTFNGIVSINEAIQGGSPDDSSHNTWRLGL